VMFSQRVFTMKFSHLQPSLLLAAGLAMPLAGLAGDPEVKPIALVSAPEAAQKMILRLVDGGRLEEVQPVDENGETSYEVSFTSKNGKEHNFTVADDGTLLSLEVLPEELPVHAWKTLRAQAPDWKLVEIDKNVSAADLTFDVLVSQKGHETSFRVDLEGELLSRELELPAAPLAVRMAITNEVPGGQVVSLDENFEPEVNSFDVEAVATNGVSHSFQLAEDGTLLSREVAWSEVFPPARQNPSH